MDAKDARVRILTYLRGMLEAAQTQPRNMSWLCTDLRGDRLKPSDEFTVRSEAESLVDELKLLENVRLLGTK